MKKGLWKQNKDWDKPVMAGFPVALFMHPAGANRFQRRLNKEHKSDPTPPSSMVPAVKRINKEGKVEYVAQR